MKKYLLLFAMVALCCGCEKTPTPKPEKPSLFVDWRTSHQYVEVVADDVLPFSKTEIVKKDVEKERSVEMSEAESYRLSFDENGTGTYSGLLPDGSGRHDYGFKWQLSGDKLSTTDIGDGYGGIFLAPDSGAMDSMEWMIEELTADKLVMSYIEIRSVNGWDLGAVWDEIHTYRYTFEKIREP